MNPQPDSDLEERWQRLEVEMNSPPPDPLATAEPERSAQPPTDSKRSFQWQIDRIINWFGSLPALGKLFVAAVAVIFGLAILRTVLKLVAAVISLAILATLLYLAYQFFVARDSETTDKN